MARRQKGTRIMVKQAYDFSALDLYEQFFESYIRLAPLHGFETGLNMPDFDPNSPHGQLMLAVCQDIIEKSSRRICDEVPY